MLFVWTYLFLGICIFKVSCECGENVAVTLNPFKPTIISSPNFENGSYPGNTSCSWVVENIATVPSDMKTYLQIDLYNLGCPDDYLRVYSGRSSAGPSIFDDFECTRNTNRTKPSVVQGPVFTEFKSSVNVSSSNIGFQITFLTVYDSSGNGCLETERLTAETQEQFITSQMFPDEFPLNSDCRWNISANTSSSVEVSVYFLDIDTDVNCTYHKLEITTNGNTTTLCHRREWKIRKFDGTEISIAFKTDARNRRAGFLIGYKTIETTTLATTVQPTTTIAPTLPPHYWDTLMMDYYAYPDYNYYGWNEPISQPVVTTTPVPTQTHHQQSSFWTMWNPFLYFWMF